MPVLLLELERLERGILNSLASTLGGKVLNWPGGETGRIASLLAGLRLCQRLADVILWAPQCPKNMRANAEKQYVVRRAL